MPPSTAPDNPGADTGIDRYQQWIASLRTEIGRMDQRGRPKRVELAHFLRTRRERVTPAEAGMAVSSRRRAPGLLREEVAQLADVSVTWYTWLEQGRPVNVSAATLNNVARALRLSPEETVHLFTLADRPLRTARGEDVPPELRLMLDGIGPNPAYLTNHCWDVVAANEALALGMFESDERAAAIERNLVIDMLTNPRRRDEIVDWERHARRVVGAFRASYGRHRHDERFKRIIERCLAESEPFRRWWAEHEIAEQRPGAIDLKHPVWGPIRYTFASFRATEAGGLRLTVYTPATPGLAERLAAALAERRAH
jgi:transcriptional regulator with XRE-family HTH domain